MTAIYVDEGQKVTRGELVLQIDDQRLQRRRGSATSLRAHAGDRDPAPAAAGREPAHAMGSHAGPPRAQAHRRGQLRHGLEQPRDRRSGPDVEPRVARAGARAARAAGGPAQQDARLLADRRHRHDARHQGRRDGDLELDEHPGLEPDDDRESREHPHRGQRRRGRHRERRDRPDGARVRDRLSGSARRRRRRFDRRVGEGRRRAAGPELRDQDPLARSREDHAAPRHDVPRRDLHGDERRRARRADPGDPRRGGPHDATRRAATCS